MPFDGNEVSPAAANLLRAKAYIAEHGWCQNAAMDEAGGVCVARAISKTRGLYQEHEAFEFFKSVTSSPYIGGWNDAPGRTLGEVCDAFDRAIDLAMA